MLRHKDSSVERLINAWGYKLKMELVSPEDQETSIVVIDHPTEKRLAFLERAIAEAGRGEIQKQLGIGKKVKVTISPM